MFDRHTIRKYFHMNKQRTVVVLADEDELSIQGQRLSSQPPSFWLYYSSNVGVVDTVYCCSVDVFFKI